MRRPRRCTHGDAVEVVALPRDLPGCEDCLRIGADWVHLRMCLTCGGIRCCDTSPHQHASKHAHDSGHPLVRSAEPGEDWGWCYVDELFLEVPSDKPARRRA